MRRGEILSLTWANVDLNQNHIYILQSKSGKGREIPIAAKLHEVLTNMGPMEPAAKVFNVPDITLRRHFEQLLKDAGIAGFRFHDLRHYADTRIMPSTCGSPSDIFLLTRHNPESVHRAWRNSRSLRIDGLTRTISLRTLYKHVVLNIKTATM